MTVATRNVRGGSAWLAGISARAGVLAIAAALLAIPGLAQDEADGKPEAKKRSVRLLAVGDQPLFRADLRDGVLRERELADGVLPPAAVKAPIGKDKELSTQLLMGNFSRVLDVPGSLQKLRLRDALGEESKTWTEVMLPEGSDPLLILLWRDPELGKWTRARHLVLRDAPAAVPPGSLRVVNVTGGLAGVRIGDEEKTVALKPGLNVVRRSAAGKALPVSVAVRGRDGEWLRLFQGEVEPGRGERSLIVIYRSDGEAPRRPAKVKVLTDRVGPVSGSGD